MDSVNLPTIESAACKEKRKQRNEFYKIMASCRPALFKYCRRLTNNPWDAEDLVQETLMVAYGRLADKHAGIQNIQSYLFKMATNQWITWCRRNKLFTGVTQNNPEPIYETEAYIVQDSLGALLDYLPPKERVALVLSEVFESKNEEIAEIMGNTEGAVKSALLRAREKVKNIKSENRKTKERANDSSQEKILDLAVNAFNRRDLESFAKLFAGNAVSHAPGCFYEIGIEEIKKGSLFYTINTVDGKPYPAIMRAEVIKIHGQAFFALFKGEDLDDIWRFTIEEGEILGFDCYYCCPDVLSEAAAILGKKANDHGYWYEQKFAHD